jgi:hypothetical protein
MAKPKMRFPEVPGGTPREKFENLVRFLLSVPSKATRPDQQVHRSEAQQDEGSHPRPEQK